MAYLDPKKVALTEINLNKTVTLAELMGQESAVVVLLDPDSEPSKHILNDLAPYNSPFNSWKGRFIFVNIFEKGSAGAVFQTYKLPARSIFTADSKDELEKSITIITGKETKNYLPAVLYATQTGDVMMLSTGYKIGMGESLMQLIKKLENKKAVLLKNSCTTP